VRAGFNLIYCRIKIKAATVRKSRALMAGRDTVHDYALRTAICFASGE
jgi:hypothetical protein